MNACLDAVVKYKMLESGWKFIRALGYGQDSSETKRSEYNVRRQEIWASF